MKKAKKHDPYDLEWFLSKQAQGYADMLSHGGPRAGFEWIACDKSGELAIFWPCEFGATPKAIHDFPVEEHLKWWRYFYSLDRAMMEGDCEIDLPEQGFYYYSTAAVKYSRWGINRDDEYPRIGQPSQPKLLNDLPAGFHAIVSLLQYPGLFREAEIIYARRYWKTFY